ncbi:MAG: hypothetical protein ACLS5R_08770 [Blautia sp.]
MCFDLKTIVGGQIHAKQLGFMDVMDVTNEGCLLIRRVTGAAESFVNAVKFRQEERFLSAETVSGTKSGCERYEIRVRITESA